MRNKHLVLERAVIAFLIFLTSSAIYAQLLARIAFPPGLLTLMAVAGGIPIGLLSVLAFIGWMRSDTLVDENHPGMD